MTTVSCCKHACSAWCSKHRCIWEAQNPINSLSALDHSKQPYFCVINIFKSLRFLITTWNIYINLMTHEFSQITTSLVFRTSNPKRSTLCFSDCWGDQQYPCSAPDSPMASSPGAREALFSILVPESFWEVMVFRSCKEDVPTRTEYDSGTFTSPDFD